MTKEALPERGRVTKINVMLFRKDRIGHNHRERCSN